MQELYLIEQSTISDLDELIDIENKLFDYSDVKLSRRAFRYHNNSQNLLLVSRVKKGKNSVISGYILVLFYRKSARIYSVAVIPEYQKLGIASALLDNSIKMSANTGKAKMALEVKVSNESAIRLYKRLGFTCKKIIPDYYLDGTDAFRMEMPLKNPIPINRSQKPGF